MNETEKKTNVKIIAESSDMIINNPFCNSIITCDVSTYSCTK